MKKGRRKKYKREDEELENGGRIQTGGGKIRKRGEEKLEKGGVRVRSRERKT